VDGELGGAEILSVPLSLTLTDRVARGGEVDNSGLVEKGEGHEGRGEELGSKSGQC